MYQPRAPNRHKQPMPQPTSCSLQKDQDQDQEQEPRPVLETVPVVDMAVPEAILGIAMGTGARFPATASSREMKDMILMMRAAKVCVFLLSIYSTALSN